MLRRFSVCCKMVEYNICSIRNSRKFSLLHRNKVPCNNRSEISSWVLKSNNARIFNYYVTQISYMKISTSSTVVQKKFLERENSFAHSLLELNPQYLDTLVPASKNKILLENEQALNKETFQLLLSQDWESKTDTQLLIDFQQITRYIFDHPLDISDPCFDKLSNALVQKAPQLNYEKLCKTLQLLSLWPPAPSSRSHNFCQVWNALDKACTGLHKTLNLPQTLLMIDHFYYLNLAGICNFSWHSLQRISRRPSKFTPQQLVQTMFYINLRRTFPEGLNIFEYQKCLESCMNKLSIDELGICCMAVFKTQNRLHSKPVFETLIRRATEEAASIENITLTAILKVIKSSMSTNFCDQLYNLLNKLETRIPELSTQSCIHIAMAGTGIQILHKGSIHATLNKILKNLPTIRIKDIERIAYVLATFNWPHSLPDNPDVDIYQLLVDEMSKTTREPEIMKHPRSFTNFLNYLSIVNTYPLQQIDLALGPKFLKNVYSQAFQKYGREMLSLDIAVEIECPEYKGSRLDKKTRSQLAKFMCQSPDVWQRDPTTGNAADRLLKEIIQTTSSIVKDADKMYVGHTLPQHLRPDILLCLGTRSSSNPWPFLCIPKSIRDCALEEVKKPNTESSAEWLCIVVGGWNHFIRNTNKPLGFIAQKLRLLTHLGYRPVLIPWYEWQTAAAKNEYLLRKMQDALFDHPASKDPLSHSSSGSV